MYVNNQEMVINVLVSMNNIFCHMTNFSFSIRQKNEFFMVLQGFIF